MTYKVIYADPPWNYTDKAKAGNRGAECKYPCMTTNDICALPINSLADDDSVLFLWATFPMLPDALHIMEAWGFTFKTVAFVWVKENRKSDSDFFGMGNWTRANAEIVLLGVKGKPHRVSASVRQIVYSPIQQHSQKPDEVRQRIVELMGDVSRIELFARETPEGWDVWGNEVTPSIELGSVDEETERCRTAEAH